MSATSTTQKALILPAPGETYVVKEFSIPRPGPADILVKIYAAGLNPLDWKITLPSPVFASMVPGYPFITGADGAGVVVEVGASVTGFQIGDRVLFLGSRAATERATFQQFCAIPSHFAAKIPEDISFEAAATVPVNLISAALGFYNQRSKAESLALKPLWSEGGKLAYAGQPILILGGASSIGQYAIQLAKASGFNPIITTASSHNAALLNSLGATHVLDRTLTNEETLVQLPKLTEGKPLQFAFDGVSLPETQTLAYRGLAPGGRLVILLPDAIPLASKEPDSGKHVAFLRGSAYLPQTWETGAEIFRELTTWLTLGTIKANAVDVVPGGLAGIPSGLERLKDGQISAKKLVVLPQETP
ncbi:GroES-like protein [Lenzites betulinus]|nr:GroES-like protein [Lenzites betulinus]